MLGSFAEQWYTLDIHFTFVFLRGWITFITNWYIQTFVFILDIIIVIMFQSLSNVISQTQHYMIVTLPIKHNMKRICWLFDPKVYLLSSNLIAVVTRKRDERVRICQLIRYTERYEPWEMDNISSGLSLFVTQ